MKHNSPLLLTGAALLLITAAVAWTEAHMDTPEGATGSEPPATTVQETFDLHVDLHVEPLYVGDETVYVLTLGAMTVAPDGQILMFSGGQMYDFVVTQEGREVWRWSDGRAFHQAFMQETFASGELRVFTVLWDGHDSNGESIVGAVEVRGELTIVPRLETKPIHLEL